MEVRQCGISLVSPWRRPVLQTAAVEEKRYEMPRKRSLTADAEETVTPLAGAPLVPHRRLDLAACFGVLSRLRSAGTTTSWAAPELFARRLRAAE